jgi:hypothetical protein
MIKCKSCKFRYNNKKNIPNIYKVKSNPIIMESISFVFNGCCLGPKVMDETLYDVRTIDPTKQCNYASEKSFNSMKSSYGRDIGFSFFFSILKTILKQTNQPIRHKRSKINKCFYHTHNTNASKAD